MALAALQNSATIGKSGRPKAEWGPPPVTIPKSPVTDEELALYLPGVKVPQKFRDMIDTFAVNDSRINDCDDKHCLLLRSDCEVARRWLHTIVIPKTLEFSVLCKYPRDGKVIDHVRGKPIPPDFHLSISNYWYATRIYAEPLKSQVTQELLDNWDALAEDNYIVKEDRRIVDGQVDQGSRESSSDSQPAVKIETLDDGKRVHIFCLHKDLFVAKWDNSKPGGKDNQLVLNCMKDVQPLNPTHLLTTHIEAGLEGSGEVVAVTLGFFVACIREVG